MGTSVGEGTSHKEALASAKRIFENPIGPRSGILRGQPSSSAFSPFSPPGQQNLHNFHQPDPAMRAKSNHLLNITNNTSNKYNPIIIDDNEEVEAGLESLEDEDVVEPSITTTTTSTTPATQQTAPRSVSPPIEVTIEDLEAFETFVENQGRGAIFPYIDELLNEEKNSTKAAVLLRLIERKKPNWEEIARRFELRL